MADYRKLSIELIAAGGTFDALESRLLKKALYADGTISHEEVQFVADLRAAVLKRKGAATEAITKFFLNALHDGIIGNGIISVGEVGILRKMLIGDKTLVGQAKKVLDKLKKEAKTTPPEFDALYGSIPTPKK